MRLWALIVKELRQIMRNRTLLISLIVPPTVQMIIFGFALNPTVNHLRMGVVDGARVHATRDLVAAFTANGTFVVGGWYLRDADAVNALSRGDIDGVLVIPPDYDRLRLQKRQPQIQLLLDATNANTAAVAQGYAAQILAAYNQTRPGVQTAVALLYNPGLVSAWFVVTGTFGILLILNGSLVAAATTMREKERGTLEQLLMTPAETSEIIIAKIAPLFMLLMMDVVLVLVVSRVVFGLAVRGPLILIFIAGALCTLVGISIGTFIATLSRTGLQAQLMSFFVNPPLALLSGATTPVEAMPPWLQPLTQLNPIRHFSAIARGVMIKGIGIDVLWPHFLALFGFTVVLVTISVRRFRNQLS